MFHSDSLQSCRRSSADRLGSATLYVQQTGSLPKMAWLKRLTAALTAPRNIADGAVTTAPEGADLAAKGTEPNAWSLSTVATRPMEKSNRSSTPVSCVVNLLGAHND